MIAIFPKKLEYILFPWLETMQETGSFKIQLTLPSGVLLGEPVIGADGRTVYNYGFGEDDVVYLQNLGAVIGEEMPGDWQYPVEVA